MLSRKQGVYGHDGTAEVILDRNSRFEYLGENEQGHKYFRLSQDEQPTEMKLSRGSVLKSETPQSDKLLKQLELQSGGAKPIRLETCHHRGDRIRGCGLLRFSAAERSSVSYRQRARDHRQRCRHNAHRCARRGHDACVYATGSNLMVELRARLPTVAEDPALGLGRAHVLDSSGGIHGSHDRARERCHIRLFLRVTPSLRSEIAVTTGPLPAFRSFRPVRMLMPLHLHQSAKRQDFVVVGQYRQII